MLAKYDTKIIFTVLYVQTGYLYTRWGNPTVDAAAEVIARLEGAKGTLLFASGCAAITTSLLSFAKAGDHIVSVCVCVCVCVCVLFPGLLYIGSCNVQMHMKLYALYMYACMDVASCIISD